MEFRDLKPEERVFLESVFVERLILHGFMILANFSLHIVLFFYILTSNFLVFHIALLLPCAFLLYYNVTTIFSSFKDAQSTHCYEIHGTVSNLLKTKKNLFYLLFGKKIYDAEFETTKNNYFIEIDNEWIRVPRRIFYKNTIGSKVAWSVSPEKHYFLKEENKD